MKRYRVTLILAFLFLSWLIFGQRLIDLLLGEEPPVEIEDVSAADLSLSGRLFYSQGRGGIWLLDLATGAAALWWQPPGNGAVRGLAASPDGSRLVIAYTRDLEEGAETGPSDLYITSTDAPDPQPLLEREVAPQEFRDPAWSPDGRWIYFTHFRIFEADENSDRAYILNVERLDPDTGERQVVVEDGQHPSLSPDGRRIVYRRFDRETFVQPLMVASLDDGPAGSSEAREIVPYGAFEAVASARFTPDGSAIVFSASGALQPSQTESQNISGRAYAHGSPWDLWRVPFEGGSFTRLTRTGIDGPHLAWSPDGTRLVMLAREGVLLLAGDRLLRLAPAVVEGEIVWTL